MRRLIVFDCSKALFRIVASDGVMEARGFLISVNEMAIRCYRAIYMKMLCRAGYLGIISILQVNIARC
jgi:hypothetical protein